MLSKVKKSNFKKRFISLVLAIVFFNISLCSLTGCMSFSEDGGGVNDVLRGIRVAYSKATVDEDYNIISYQDETFRSDLIKQYANISIEILLSLSNSFGKGIKDETIALNAIESSFKGGDFADLQNVSFAYSEIPQDDLLYCELNNWSWGSSVSDSLPTDLYAAAFCSNENIFKMQVALYCINMGVDCSKSGYGNGNQYFTQSVDQSTIVKIASSPSVKHSGILIDEENPEAESNYELTMLAEFIKNNVMGSSAPVSVTEIKELLIQILLSTDSNGRKYVVTASSMVKDYYIKEIAIGEEEQMEDDSDFFTMNLGEQLYRSIVFMPCATFALNSMYLVFQSQYDIILTVRVRVYDASSGTYLVDKELDPLVIEKGKYNDSDNPCELDIDLSGLIEEESSITDYKFSPYKEDTDVSCFGGIGGTGIGDGLFDKFGYSIPLKTSNDGKDKLTELYTVNKSSKDSSGYVTFQKTDSCYTEIVFETDNNKPFEVGFLVFDYEDPED